jgi:hyperosmotically inducible periplasmic protein
MNRPATEGGVIGMIVSRAKVLILTLAMGVCVASAQQDADNTKANQQPKNKMETADQAKNSKTDLRLMKQIRRAIVKDKSLSTSAHNVKVIASGGKVTLAGPVKSDEEKQAIEQKAIKVAGDGNVTNEITVAASNQ